MTDDVTDWQTRLTEAMEARGLSGSELGRRSGFTSQYINSLRNKDRGGRLPHDTARRLAAALGVSLEWLLSGSGPRERLSDVYPVYRADEEPASGFVDKYPSRTEAIALLASMVASDVIRALLTVVPPEPGEDPGRAFWIDYAKQLARDYQRIQADPAFRGEPEPSPKPKPKPEPKRSAK